jgi:hypothetical protein
LRQNNCPKNWPIKIARSCLDSQALAAFGTARVDDSAATASLHANEKAVGAGAADFGRLVGTFHFESLLNLLLLPQQQSGKPKIMANFLSQGKMSDG